MSRVVRPKAADETGSEKKLIGIDCGKGPAEILILTR